MKTLFFVIALVFLFSCSDENKSSEKKENLEKTGYDTLQLIDNYLSDLSDKRNFSGGLLIIKGNKKYFAKGYGWADKEKHIEFDTRTLASMGSITKLFTATAIMKLVEEGKINLQDNLKKFFPSVPSDKAGITIHQLLTHSSGFIEFLENDGGDFEKIETQKYLQRAFQSKLAFEPGKKAIYTNVGMSILGIIIEQVSGMDYEKYLQENLFTPNGIKNIGYHYPNTTGEIIAHGYENGNDYGTIPGKFEENGGGPYWNLKANGGLEVSLDEMLLWCNAFTDTKILSKNSIEQMFTEHIAEESMEGYSFGYGCNISKSRRNTKMIDNGGSNGIYYARLIRLPEENIIFYMVTNESSINTNMVLPNITQLFFTGEIQENALVRNVMFEYPMAKEVYEILIKKDISDLSSELKSEGIEVEDDMALYEVGDRLVKEGSEDKAIILYEYYTKKFPNIVVCWNELGELYLRKDRKEEARKCFEQALKIRPENERAKQNLSKIN